jgi:hypothetical protein
MVQFMKDFLRLQDSSFDDNSSTNSSTNSSCPSSPAKWCVYDYNGYKLCIENPTLIPTCFLALLIGLICSKRISQLPGKFPSRWFYQLTFFLYGIMMTSAGILHCFLNDQPKNTNDDSIRMVYLLVAVIDVGLTSNIAITFLFSGLCDIKFFNPKSHCTRWLLYILYFTIFLLWTLGILNNWHWSYDILYLGIISISCFIYLLTQLSIKSNHRALPVLFVGGFYGGIGLLATSIGAEHICESEGPFWSQYIGPEFIWFLFSDISMALICLYVIRANQEKKIMMKKKQAIDTERYPEKF